AGVGLLVRIIDEYGGGERELPLDAGADRDRSGAWHDHGALGNHDRRIGTWPDDRAVREVVHRRGPREHGACTDDGALLDHGAFIDPCIATDEHIILDD